MIEDHSAETCTNKIMKCVNCGENHSALDRQCKTFKAAKYALRRKKLIQLTGKALERPKKNEHENNYKHALIKYSDCGEEYKKWTNAHEKKIDALQQKVQTETENFKNDHLEVMQIARENTEKNEKALENSEKILQLALKTFNSIENTMTMIAKKECQILEANIDNKFSETKEQINITNNRIGFLEQTLFKAGILKENLNGHMAVPQPENNALNWPQSFSTAHRNHYNQINSTNNSKNFENNGSFSKHWDHSQPSPGHQ